MITVEIIYKKLNHPTEDVFFYKKVLVTGHANSGDMDSIKCCAGVTAILGGFKQCVIGAYDSVDLKKGSFEYNTYGDYSDLKTTQIQLDCVIFQLFSVYQCYKHLFTKFEFIQEK